MNEAVTKRFLLCFRLMLLVWILIVNSILHVVGFEYSWLIFLSNIMLFTMEGDIKDRFVSVELGGLWCSCAHLLTFGVVIFAHIMHSNKDAPAARVIRVSVGAALFTRLPVQRTNTLFHCAAPFMPDASSGFACHRVRPGNTALHLSQVRCGLQSVGQCLPAVPASSS